MNYDRIKHGCVTAVQDKDIGVPEWQYIYARNVEPMAVLELVIIVETLLANARGTSPEFVAKMHERLGFPDL